MRVTNMTTAALNAEYDELDGHDCTYENDCPACLRINLVEAELDARYLWDSDDERIAESVGNYRNGQPFERK